MTPDPDIQREEHDVEMYLGALEDQFLKVFADVTTTETFLDRLLTSAAQPPAESTLTREDFRQAYERLMPYPRPETPGDRAMRRLREMGIEIRLFEPVSPFVLPGT